MWFFWKNINFCLTDNFYQYCLYDNAYKYSKEEKRMLKNLNLIEMEDENEKIKENNEIVITDSLKTSVIKEKLINMDIINIRETYKRNTNKRV